MTSARFSLLLLALCGACAGTQRTIQSAPQPTSQESASPSPPQPSAAVANPPAAASQSDAAPDASPPPRHSSVAQATSAEDDEARYRDVVTEHGQRARGLYFNAPMSRRLGARGIIQTVKAAGMDAAVIDLKDGEGRVSFDTQIAALEPEKKKIFLRDAPAFVRELKDAGIYTIARIVCFSDPVLPRVDPSRAVMDTHPRREGQVWNNTARRNSWLDPYNEKNHDLIVALAQEAQELGFDEIQLDYIRFPVDEGTKFARFPAQTERPRREVILGLLRRLDEALHIPLGADVFGLSAFRKGDPAGLGQSLEEWTKHVEVFSPMLYVNGMGAWMRHQKEGRAGLLVQAGVKALRDRIGATPVIRPFLQAFSNGADYYDPRFIAEQVRGAGSGGGDGFLFWHPASNYGMVRAGMQGPARGVSPFPQEARQEARRLAWGEAASASAQQASAVQAEPTSDEASATPGKAAPADETQSESAKTVTRDSGSPVAHKPAG